MGVVNHIETKGVDEASDSSKAVQYHVETDAGKEALNVLFDNQVPQPGDRHPDHPTWIAQTGRSVESANRDRNIWTVSVTFKKRSNYAVLTGDRDRIQRYRLGTKRYQTAMEWAYPKKPGDPWFSKKQAVTNSAGDRYDPPVETVERNILLQWTQRESLGFDPWKVINQIGSINKNAVTVLGRDIEPEQARISDAEPSWSGEEYVTRYEVEISKEHSIVPLLVDQGYRKREGGGLVDIKKSDLKSSEPNEPVDDPVFLDGAGGIHPDELSGSGPIGDPYKFYWRNDELVDWDTELDLVKDAPA